MALIKSVLIKKKGRGILMIFRPFPIGRRHIPLNFKSCPLEYPLWCFPFNWLFIYSFSIGWWGGGGGCLILSLIIIYTTTTIINIIINIIISIIIIIGFFGFSEKPIGFYIYPFRYDYTTISPFLTDSFLSVKKNWTKY